MSGDTTLGGLERSDWVLEQENAKILILELGANDLLRGVPVAKERRISRRSSKKQKPRILRSCCAACLPRRRWVPNTSVNLRSLFPDLATEYKVEFLPFLLENVALKKELNQADGIHPNAEGEKIMTDNVYQGVKPLL